MWKTITSRKHELQGGVGRMECNSLTDAFLRMNEHFIDCEGEAAYEYFMALFETGSFRYAALETWLKEHVKILPTFN